MDQQLISLLVASTGETIYMTVLSTFVAYLIGTPLGVLLYITSKEGTRPNAVVNFIVGLIVNVLRSVPFLILLVAILPFTRLVAGTTLGMLIADIPAVFIGNKFASKIPMRLVHSVAAAIFAILGLLTLFKVEEYF